jgi:hypothetical protein
VFVLPHGAVLRPTDDHLAVRHALASVVAGRGLRAASFNLTPAEIIDITAADGQMDPLPRPAAAGRAAGGAPLGLPANETLRQVQLRECRSNADQTCAQGIVSEASAMSRQFEEHADETLAGLNALMQLLQNYPTRQTVVLLSAGLPVSDRQGGWFSDGGPARGIGRNAALANATIYALHVDNQASAAGYSAETRTPRSDLARERELQELLLEELAMSSGGALLSAPTGSASVALDRLLRETSSLYLLGVAPDARDLDGRVHELRVKVNARNSNVRSRRFVALPRPH